MLFPRARAWPANFSFIFSLPFPGCFCFPSLCLPLISQDGSVRYPVSADMATVAGDARYTAESLLPILPGKFRLEVVTHTSPAARTPWWALRQGPHPGADMVAPASMRVSRKPFAIHSLSTSADAGITTIRTWGAIVRPFSMRAASPISSTRPPVHAPTNAWSMRTLPARPPHPHYPRWRAWKPGASVRLYQRHRFPHIQNHRPSAPP